jgi:hypothetical protein
MEIRLKVRKILNFSTLLDIATLKYTYVLLTFTLKVIICQVNVKVHFNTF